MSNSNMAQHGVLPGGGDKIAILLATYNGGRYIAAFLDSLITQTADNLVLYVRDDGSTDSTMDIIASYATRLSIHVVTASQRLGPAHSFMTLLAAASDECGYFAFADQDDVWVSNKLERARATLAGDPSEPSLYFARVEYVDEQLAPLGFSTLASNVTFPSALVENVAMGCTMLINRAARALVVAATPARLTMHDWWVYLLINALGRVHADDFVALQYRQHANNAVGGTSSVTREYVRKLTGFLGRGNEEITISQQAEELSMHYRQHMSVLQNAQVDRLRFSVGKPLQRFAMCVWSPFVRQRGVDTVILRVLFLLGRY